MEYGVTVAFKVKCDENEIYDVMRSFVDNIQEIAKMYLSDGIDIYEIDTDSIECIDFEE
jgi:hypothetical protein